MDYSGAPKTTETPAQPATKPRLPDPELCRAQLAGFADRVNCITPRQWSCRYAIPFGLGYLCVHPDRFEIAARTPRNGGGQP